MPILSQAPGVVSFAALANANATTISGASLTTIQLCAANTNTTGLASGSALALPIPGSGKLEGRRFKVFLGGVVTIVTTSSTFKVDFYAVSGTTGLPALASQLTAGSYTKLTASSATSSLTGAAAPGTIYSFFSFLDLYGDTISGTLSGTQTTQVNNVSIDAAVVLTNKLTSVTFGPATAAATTVQDPAAWIVPAATFSAAHAGTQVQFDSFYCFSE